MGIEPIAGCLQSISPPQRIPREWSRGESDPDLSLAKAPCSRYHYDPELVRLARLELAAARL